MAMFMNPMMGGMMMGPMMGMMGGMMMGGMFGGFSSGMYGGAGNIFGSPMMGGMMGGMMGSMLGGMMGGPMGMMMGGLTGGLLGGLLGRHRGFCPQQYPQAAMYPPPYGGGGFGGPMYGGYGMPYGGGAYGAGYERGFENGAYTRGYENGSYARGYENGYDAGRFGYGPQCPPNRGYYGGGYGERGNSGHLCQKKPGGPINYTTSGGYHIHVNGHTVDITSPDGKHTVEEWGDPHEKLDGKSVDNWNSATHSILLPDGTKITMNASAHNKPIQSMSIYDGNRNIQIDNNNNTITHQSFNPWDTYARDRSQADGETSIFRENPNGSAFLGNLYNQDPNMGVQWQYQPVATSNTTGSWWGNLFSGRGVHVF